MKIQELTRKINRLTRENKSLRIKRSCLIKALECATLFNPSESNAILKHKLQELTVMLNGYDTLLTDNGVLDKGEVRCLIQNIYRKQKAKK